MEEENYQIQEIETNTPVYLPLEVQSDVPNPKPVRKWSWNTFFIGNEEFGVITALLINLLTILSAFLVDNNAQLLQLVSPQFLVNLGAFLSTALVILKGLRKISKK